MAIFAKSFRNEKVGWRSKKSGRRKESGRRQEVSLAMIAANNHYPDFGQGTANLFRKMVGLSELSWEDPQEIQNQLRLKLRRE